MYIKNYETFISESYKTAKQEDKIKKLDLAGLFKNERQIANDFDRYVNVEELDLGNNRHYLEIPSSVFKMEHLKLLDMWHCNVKSIPDEIENVQTLEELNLRSNFIVKVSSKIGKLHNLKKLLLGGNNIEKLPDSICNLTSLETLDVGDNMLTSLPENIGNLSSLKDLDISDSDITTLPISIMKLDNLETFEMDKTILRDIPLELSTWKFFKQLRLELNDELWTKLMLYDIDAIYHKDYAEAGKLRFIHNSINPKLAIHISEMLKDKKQMPEDLQKELIDLIRKYTVNINGDTFPEISNGIMWAIGKMSKDVQEYLMETIRKSKLKYDDFKQFIDPDVFNARRGSVSMRRLKDIIY
jgi:hypothetical protein